MEGMTTIAELRARERKHEEESRLTEESLDTKWYRARQVDFKIDDLKRELQRLEAQKARILAEE